MSGSLAANRWLDASHRIAREITETAVWDGDRCNWTGMTPEDAPGRGIAMSCRALGADLYGGSAGVGLFLAEAACATGDAHCRDAALGALRHAVSRADSLSAVSHLGLYAGTPGLALALALAARALEDDALRDRALHIACESGASSPDDEPDVMSGSAGAVVAKLRLAELLGEERLLGAAVQHGDALLGAAVQTDAGLCWPSRALPAARGLTGLSHGAAGIAVALLELAGATGDDRYGAAARSAFDYERSLYDEAAGNWPDLRQLPSASPDGGKSFATFWCHGAPGGALARLRALELGDGEQLRCEAEAALRTTESWVGAALASGTANYSLCHGLAGNAEILLEGSRLVPSLAGTVGEVATTGVEAYLDAGRPWPSGAYGQPTPSLFLGLAGIGRFYLRLASPEVPSLLVVRPRGSCSSTRDHI
jgi:lantibiotic biosynthesis protein